MTVEFGLADAETRRLDVEISKVVNDRQADFPAIARNILQLIKNRQHREAAYFGSKAFPMQPLPEQAQTYGHLFEKWAECVYKSLPRPEAQSYIRAVCEEDIRFNGRMAWNVLFHASTRFSPTAPDDTFEDFRFVTEADQRNITANVHGASSVRRVASVMTLPVGENPMGFSDVTFSTPRHDHVTLIHLVSCDWSYWEIFHERLLASLSELSLPQVMTHVHIMNPGQSLGELRDFVRRDYLGVNVAFSSERFAIPEAWHAQWGGFNVRSLYTFLRFLRASEVLEHYGKPIVISEFDSEIGPGIARAAELNDAHDVALVSMAGTSQDFFPWNQVWAGTLFAKPNDGAKHFLQLVSSYCETVYAEEIARERPLWHVDQNALFFVSKFLETLPGQCRIGRFANEARPVTRNFGNMASVKPKHGGLKNSGKA